MELYEDHEPICVNVVNQTVRKKASDRRSSVSFIMDGSTSVVKICPRNPHRVRATISVISSNVIFIGDRAHLGGGFPTGVLPAGFLGNGQIMVYTGEESLYAVSNAPGANERVSVIDEWNDQ